MITLFFFLRLYLFIFRERGRKGEREGGKHQCVVASHMAPTGDLARNLSMHTDWESNQQPFGLQSTLNPLSYTSQGLIITLLIFKLIVKLLPEINQGIFSSLPYLYSTRNILIPSPSKQLKIPYGRLLKRISNMKFLVGKIKIDFLDLETKFSQLFFFIHTTGLWVSKTLLNL